jgi:hypothetical protein
MTYKCNQTGAVISPAPVKEFFTYTDRSALPVGGSVTADDGSRYLLLNLEAITETLSKLVLVPATNGGPIQ